MKFTGLYEIVIDKYVNSGYRAKCNCGWKSAFFPKLDDLIRDTAVSHAQTVHGVSMQQH